MGKKEKKIDENEGNTPKINNIIYSKNSIQFRNDNIVNLINLNGKSLDKNTEILIKNRNIKPKLSFTENIIEIINIDNKKLFMLYIDTSVSCKLIKEGLIRLFNQLKELLITKNICIYSISKDIEILNISWLEIEEILKEIFNNTNIKIIVCLNNIEYVKIEDRDRIFEMYHSSTIGGHSGVNRTYNRLKEKYFWENLKLDIQNRIKDCEDCQRNKLKRKKTKQPMVITDTPGKTFDKIAMDIVGPFNITKNNNKYILSIQDQLSKFIILACLKDQSAESVSDAFIKKFICIFGTPKIVLTDRRANFTSNIMKQIAKRFKFDKIETTAFSPQSNGSLERADHPLCEYLKNFSTKKYQWNDLLEFAQFHYNTIVHTSHKFTPYEIVFASARIPSSEPIKKSELLPTYNGYLERLIKNMREIAEIARENLIVSKQKFKNYYDRFINPVRFDKNDKVWLIKEPKPGKLEKDHYQGPFDIIKVNENNSITINYKGKGKTVHSNKLSLVNEKK